MFLVSAIQISVLLLMSLPMVSFAVISDKMNILLCESRCRTYGGCKGVYFTTKHLRCELIFGRIDKSTKKAMSIVSKIRDEDSVRNCPDKYRAIQSNRGASKCVESDLQSLKDNLGLTSVNAKCEGCRPTGDPCILYKEENITVHDMSRVLKLPFVLKPGMRLTVTGGRKEDAVSSAFSFPMDPEHTSNFHTWFHVEPYWNKKKLYIIKGVILRSFKGDFPISDPSNFTLALELTPSSSKVYVDGFLVKSMKVFPGIAELDVLRYSEVYDLVVRKTGVGCDEVVSG